MKLSVIIPALNEEKNIMACIESAGQLNPLEIIVVDGRSNDRTKEIAQGTGAVVIESPMGRGIQMNAGASFAKGDLLMFLHADSHLSLRGKAKTSLVQDLLRITYYDPHHVGGFFRLKFDEESISTRLVELFANLRARLFSLPYGDQAIFIRRDVFEAIGGFNDYPFLEDLDMVLRLRKIGRLKRLPFKVVASSRRLKKGYPFSPVVVSLRNALIALLFIAGVSPFSLLRLYK